MNFRVHCLICDESIKLNKQDMILVENGRDIIRVCDKCKEAVKYIRNTMQNQKDNQDDS